MISVDGDIKNQYNHSIRKEREFDGYLKNDTCIRKFFGKLVMKCDKAVNTLGTALVNYIDKTDDCFIWTIYY